MANFPTKMKTGRDKSAAGGVIGPRGERLTSSDNWSRVPAWKALASLVMTEEHINESAGNIRGETTKADTTHLRNINMPALSIFRATDFHDFSRWNFCRASSGRRGSTGGGASGSGRAGPARPIPAIEAEQPMWLPTGS
ncbi:hypothetical protein Bbelb_434450 [Branchiostoma belcheri]|nr:hypothetical protein Bbelb_434450 [Branchiostoma belcheri]